MQHMGLLKGICINKFWYYTCWCLWLQRNKVVFHGTELDVMSIVSHIMNLIWIWFMYKGSIHNGLMFSNWYNNPLECFKEVVG